MEQQLNFERIEAFLNGELQGEELQSFHQQLSSDNSFAFEVNLHRGLSMALSDGRTIQLENTILQVGEKYKSKFREEKPRQKLVYFIKKYRAIAASLVLIIAAAIVLQPESKEPADLYAKYFEPYPSYLKTRTDSEINKKLEVAIDAYERKNYQVAWSAFMEVAAQDDGNMGILFYTAISALHLGKTADAVAGFKKVAKQADNIYASSAEWYLALSFLKEGDKRNAQETLKGIAENGGDYAGQANKLILDLD